MNFKRLSSPLGSIILSSDGKNLTGFYFEGQRYFEETPTEWREVSDEVLTLAALQVEEYFAGARKSFDLPLTAGGTEFQKTVWRALQDIPYGTLTTYSQIAEKIGRAGAVRAVGTAVGRNPLCVIVPCHRVVATGGGLGGYVAGLACKERLLRLEGSLAG